MRLVSCVAISLALVACSQDAEAPVDSEVTPENAVDDEVLADSETSLADAALGGATQADGMIPQRFRGVWDYVEGTCMASSDLRLEIRADGIEFYESMGEVTGVEVVGPDEVVVAMDMEGEGERWTSRIRYTLSDDGERLTPTDAEEPNAYDPMVRKRCPAG
ncbi:MAG: hypothetical protein WBA68_01330 [Alteraurantiacibacter sp.]